MKIQNYLTYIGTSEDVDILTRKSFDVNMRLYKSSPDYYDLIKLISQYLIKLSLTKMEGYPLPYGMSGANIGIPFNIIGVVKNRGQSNSYCDILINPKILESSEECVEVLSNCGSIRLEEKVKVKRHKWVKVSWFDLDGLNHIQKFSQKEGGFTIQHEVDHNLGVLITDMSGLVK